MACCEVNQACSLLLHYGKQRRYRLVRFFDLQGETSVFTPYRLHAGKTTPNAITIVTHGVAEGKLNHMVPAQARNQFGWSDCGNDLSVIDDGQPVAYRTRLLPTLPARGRWCNPTGLLTREGASFWSHGTSDPSRGSFQN